jgi:hypothetical protein
MKKITAQDFIKIYIELKALSPVAEKWSEEYFHDNPPRLVRLNQLVSLKKAFGINENWAQFDRADFIVRFPIEAYDSLKQKIKHLKNTESWNKQPFEKFIYADMVKIFRLFVKFLAIERELMESTTWFSLTYSLGQMYGYEQTNSYFTPTKSKKTKAMIEDLAFMIDPLNLSFSESELISKYGYLKVDLEDIDLAYW